MTLRARLLAPLLLVPLAACSTPPRTCTLIRVESGVHVATDALPAGATGQVCLVGGPCVGVPGEGLPVVLPLPEREATVEVDVRLAGRAVQRLPVQVSADYVNGRDCGAAGYVGRLRLTATGATAD